MSFSVSNILIPFCCILFLNSCYVYGQTSFNATTCNSKLVSPRSDVAVAYDGADSIYIFGGVFFTEDFNLLVYDEIHRFNITSDKIEVVATLPRTAHGGRAHFRPDVGDILYLRADGTFLWSYNVTTGVTTSLSEWLGSSSGVGLTFLPDRVMAFGGLENATLIYSLDLGTNSQNPSGDLPLPTELAVSLYSPAQQSTFIFAGELGNRTPVLMKYMHQFNTTSVQAWLFPSFRHGDGSPVLVSTSEDSNPLMYIFGAVIDNGAIGDTVMEVNLATGSTKIIPLFGVPTQLTTTSAVYVESQNRIYFFGGYDLSNEDKDSIWYVQLDQTHHTNE